MKALPISIIIPTFNEEKYLPKLLKSIKNQTRQPAEIIVADYNSTDKTVTIAQKFGCKIVEGGRPAVGRNAGARAARQSTLLFLDSDVILAPDFLELSFQEFQHRYLDSASVYFEPISNLLIDKAIIAGWNTVFAMLLPFSPTACGSCIIATKEVHKYIGGFDERIYVGEDVDYVRRIRKIGNFTFLVSRKLHVSLRRLIEEGRMLFIWKNTIILIHSFFTPMKKPLIKYEFGDHYAD